MGGRRDGVIGYFDASSAGGALGFSRGARYDWNAVMRIEIRIPGMLAPSLAA